MATGKCLELRKIPTPKPRLYLACGDSFPISRRQQKQLSKVIKLQKRKEMKAKKEKGVV